MVVAETLDPATIRLAVDQRVHLHGVSWSEYEALLEMRGECAVPRISYLDGELELMTPSGRHETVKTTLARLVEAYSDELELGLEGFGSWTLKRKKTETGCEPDECYAFGTRQEGEVPDLAIEVNWTSGGLDKLEIYRRLGVREVWVWQHEEISVHALRAGGYERIAKSELLPQIDLELLRELLELPTQTAAVRELRARLRRSG
jgi:Uma2 family endonuclease